MSERTTTRIHRAELARYLRGLGWQDLHLPDGLPVAAAGLAGEREAPPSASEDRQRRRRSEGSSAGDAARAGSSVAASFDIPDDLSREDRRARLEEIRSHASACTACALAEKRNLVVFGEGAAEASLMIIGEGPGAQEDRRGEPFVGPAGELLTRMLAAIELERDGVFIANVVKCRPPGNRDPRPEEVTACSGYLEAQVRLIRPRLILALGRVAAQSLLKTGEPLGRLRGRWHEYCDVPVRVTYHPAALLRNTGYKRPAWEDLQLIRDRLLELADTEG